MAKTTNIRKRGNSYVVNLRVNGQKVWKSFTSEDEAEVFLAQTRAARRAKTYQPPAKATFRQAAENWYEHGSTQGGKRGPWKTSTRTGYRSALDVHLLPEFGERQLGEISDRTVEEWLTRQMQSGAVRARTANKLQVMLSAIFERARKQYRHPTNPLSGVDKIAAPKPRTIEHYSPEEVYALVRAAASERDAALYLTAAFTGLRRGELIALRVRAVDFAGEVIRVEAGYSNGELSTPKSGVARAVPMVEEVAQALARLLAARGNPGPEELVFPGGGKDGYLAGPAVGRRYRQAQKKAGLRPLRFHDLRHTFGSLAIKTTDVRDVQAMMGHADLQTTTRYLHHKPQKDAARKLAKAFRPTAPLPGDNFDTEAAEDAKAQL